MNLKQPKAAKHKWPITFATTVWWLWRWRNIRCFERTDFEPRRPCEFILERSKEIVKAMYPSRIALLPRVEKLIKWIAPLDGWIKLNVDGASRPNSGKAGGGGVLRNQTSHWISGFIANFGICSSVKAELLALLQGLRMAWSRGVKKLLIEIDSMIVLNKIQFPARPHHPHFFIIKECQDLSLIHI